MNEIVNKVEASGLITLNLEDYLPKEDLAVFDLKNHLFMGLILREKDFREALKTLDWSIFHQKNVAITCTADAIIPVWAYMLVTTYLQPVAHSIYTGTIEEMQKHLLLQNIRAINVNDFAGSRVVVKGCGDVAIGPYAYAEIARVLLPQVKSLMYGEPCSTVPIYKKSSTAAIVEKSGA